MVERATRKVMMSPELMEQWATRDAAGNRLIWDWREPDAEGIWEPIVRVDYDDNLCVDLAKCIEERVAGLGVNDAIARHDEELLNLNRTLAECIAVVRECAAEAVRAERKVGPSESDRAPD